MRRFPVYLPALPALALHPLSLPSCCCSCAAQNLRARDLPLGAPHYDALICPRNQEHWISDGHSSTLLCARIGVPTLLFLPHSPAFCPRLARRFSEPRVGRFVCRWNLFSLALPLPAIYCAHPHHTIYPPRLAVPANLFDARGQLGSLFSSFPLFFLSTRGAQAKAKDDKKAAPAKTAKSSGSGKAKKKKWSKGKVRDKLANLPMFDKAGYDKLLKEVPTWKLITPAVVSDRLKIKMSLARRGLALLLEKNAIKEVAKHASLAIYTRATAAAE
eukprot:m.20833 g.20833  ORF g.20833 m.20833 type:complete len:273 (+) comp32312_c0_seq1:78-896(+)